MRFYSTFADLFHTGSENFLQKISDSEATPVLSNLRSLRGIANQFRHSWRCSPSFTMPHSLIIFTSKPNLIFLSRADYAKLVIFSDEVTALVWLPSVVE